MIVSSWEHTAFASDPCLNDGKMRWKSSLAVATPPSSLLSGWQEHANIAYISHWSSLVSTSCDGWALPPNSAGVIWASLCITSSLQKPTRSTIHRGTSISQNDSHKPHPIISLFHIGTLTNTIQGAVWLGKGVENWKWSSRYNPIFSYLVCRNFAAKAAKCKANQTTNNGAVVATLFPFPNYYFPTPFPKCSKPNTPYKPSHRAIIYMHIEFCTNTILAYPVLTQIVFL